MGFLRPAIPALCSCPLNVGHWVIYMFSCILDMFSYILVPGTSCMVHGVHLISQVSQLTTHKKVSREPDEHLMYMALVTPDIHTLY